MKKIFCTILSIVMLLSLCACGETKTSGPENEVTSVKLACLASTEPRLQLCKEILAEINVDCEIVLCEGNAGPATALLEGDVDGEIVNHLPWITAFNEANNCNLVMMQPYAYYCPTRMYSSKWNSVEEIPDNANIVISNDPSNLSIALTMLQSCGLIELGEMTDSYYSEADIIANPKNLQFTLTDTVYVVSSYNEADAIICFSNYAVAGDFDATKYLYENPTDKDKCPCGLIVNEENQDAEWAKYLAEQLATEKWINRAIEIYGEGAHGYYID